jgi:hypothetical protein
MILILSLLNLLPRRTCGFGIATSKLILNSHDDIKITYVRKDSKMEKLYHVILLGLAIVMTWDTIYLMVSTLLEPFVNTIHKPKGMKNSYFSNAQDVVRRRTLGAFGVLQARFCDYVWTCSLWVPVMHVKYIHELCRLLC